MRIIPTLGVAARCPHFIGLSAIRACGRLMQVKMSRTRTHARRGKTEAATALVADACNWDGVVFASSATTCRAIAAPLTRAARKRHPRRDVATFTL